MREGSFDVHELEEYKKADREYAEAFKVFVSEGSSHAIEASLWALLRLMHKQDSFSAWATYQGLEGGLRLETKTADPEIGLNVSSALSPEELLLASGIRSACANVLHMCHERCTLLETVNVPDSCSLRKLLSSTYPRKTATVKEWFEVNLSELLCEAYCDACKWADVCQSPEDAEQAIFKAVGICQRLLLRYNAHGKIYGVAHTAIRRLQDHSGAGATFGKMLWKIFKDLEKNEPAKSCRALWSVFAELVQAADRRRSGDYEAAMSHVAQSERMIASLSKHNMWNRDGGRGIFGEMVHEDGDTSSPLTKLKTTIENEKMKTLMIKLIRRARSTLFAAEATFIEEQADMLNVLNALTSAVVHLDSKSWQCSLTASNLDGAVRVIASASSLEDLQLYARAVLSLCGCAQEGIDGELDAATKQAAKKFRPHCAACGEAESEEDRKFQYCVCKSVKYCSRACQKQHWKARHKEECSARSAVRMR